MIEEERVRTGRLARIGSILFLLLAVVACSGTATPSPTVVTSSARLATRSPIPTPIPTPSPTASPRPMALATVKPGPAMTEPLEGGQAAVRLDDGRVLIMGGTVPFTGTCEMTCPMPPATASVEVYDPKTGEFRPNGSLAEPRAGADTLVLNDGRVLVSGGDGRYGDFLRTIEIYDPGQGTSIVVTPPADLPNQAAVVLLADGRVLFAGGAYGLEETTSNLTLIFDPASGGVGNGPPPATNRKRGGGRRPPAGGG